MLRIMSFLGLVVGMTACRAPEPVTEVGQRPETPERTLPHVFFIEHGAQPSFEPMTRRVLSVEEASVLAAGLANDQCERQYRRRPFKPEQYPAILREGAYHWGNLDVGGHEGFSASVSFNPDGSEPHVEIYFSSDTVLGMK
jgi:hypothetical protein